MSTNTNFKQRSCMKCGRNHGETGLLCSFCRDQAERQMLKQKQSPAHYWVECLIPRDGDTELTINNMRYRFTKNEHGHSVCQMINPGHYAQILKSGFYRPYDIPEHNEVIDEPNKEDNGNRKEWLPADKIATVDALAAEGKKPSEIAKILADVDPDNPISYQRIGKYLAERDGE